MEEHGGRRRRLVLVPCPIQGHINPMLQLGTILHSRGFSITIAISKFDFPDTSNHPDFVFLPVLNDSLSKSKDPGDMGALISNLNLSYRVSLQELLIEMIEKQQLERHDHQELPCIIYDPIVYSAEAVAHHLKLPSIVLQTSSVTFLLAFYACPKIEKEDYTPWSHCGWNSTLESVSEGVAMICRPFTADQKLISRHVNHVWRVGIELEKVFERGEIERAIKFLMVEKEGEEIKQRSAELKLELQLSVQKGGSSYNSLNELVEFIVSV